MSIRSQLFMSRGCGVFFFWEGGIHVTLGQGGLDFLEFPFEWTGGVFFILIILLILVDTL